MYILGTTFAVVVILASIAIPTGVLIVCIRDLLESHREGKRRATNQAIVIALDAGTSDSRGVSYTQYAAKLAAGGQPWPSYGSQASGYYVGQHVAPQTAAQYNALATQAALAAQLAHTTPTSQWNGANYYQPPVESPLDRVHRAMRATGCEHDLKILRLATSYTTEVIHDHRHRMECADIDGTLYHTYDRTDEVLAWLQSICDGSGEFWSWHEAYGVWEDWRE